MRFDLDWLLKLREQLWAEAAAAEAMGEDIRLDPRLYDAAAAEQAVRMVVDPRFEVIAEIIGDRHGEIACADVWKILEVSVGRRTHQHNERIGAIMRQAAASTAGHCSL